MKQEVKPAQAAVIVVVVLVLAIGLGYYFMRQSDGSSYPSMPAAHSRAEMLSKFHVGAPSSNAPSAALERRQKHNQ